MRLVFADWGIHDPHTTNGVQMVCLNPLASIYDRRHVCHQDFVPVAPTNLTADRINLLFWMNELSGLSREYQYQFTGSYTIACTSNMAVPRKPMLRRKITNMLGIAETRNREEIHGGSPLQP